MSMYSDSIERQLHNIKRQVEEGRVECKVCQGKSIISRYQIEIKDICYHCKGEGSVDWVQNATGNPSPIVLSERIGRSLRHRVLMDNVHRMVSEIKRLFYSEGVIAEVNVNILQEEDRFSSPTDYVGQLSTDPQPKKSKFKRIISL